MKVKRLLTVALWVANIVLGVFTALHVTNGGTTGAAAGISAVESVREVESCHLGERKIDCGTMVCWDQDLGTYGGEGTIGTLMTLFFTVVCFPTWLWGTAACALVYGGFAVGRATALDRAFRSPVRERSETMASPLELDEDDHRIASRIRAVPMEDPQASSGSSDAEETVAPSPSDDGAHRSNGNRKPGTPSVKLFSPETVQSTPVTRKGGLRK